MTSEASESSRRPELFTLESESVRAVLTDGGARLLELWVPDRDGFSADIVLGRATIDEAFHDDNYMGSIAGRYANRIREGLFVLDGVEHQLEKNEGANHLHGGFDGFDRRFWDAERSEDGRAITFRLTSPDGDGGYPGRLDVSTEYRLEGETLRITMTATTDAATVLNIVHHSYFNLRGHDSGDVLEHELQIDSAFYTPVDAELLPTGEVFSVEGTPYDFREAKTIGADIAAVENQAAGRDAGDNPGYDHNWILSGRGLRDVLWAHDPVSGRVLRLATDQAGVQIYVGGYLGGVTAKGNLDKYAPFGGFTLETQTFPDSPNVSHFPSPVVRAGETYTNIMQLTFDTDAENE